jgi:hypothetical protein
MKMTLLPKEEVYVLNILFQKFDKELAVGLFISFVKVTSTIISYSTHPLFPPVNSSRQYIECPA